MSASPAADTGGSVDPSGGPAPSVDLEAQRAELAALTAALERDLWTQSGMEDELGGAAATDAAFDALTTALIDQAATFTRDPSYGRFGGSVSTADEITAGGMLFAGFLMVGIGAKATVEATNDLKPGERPEPAGRSDDESTFEISGTLEKATLATTLNKTLDGVTGKLLTKIDIAPCPDSTGVFTAKVLIEASATSTGGRTGSNMSSEIAITGRVGDDAELTGYDTTNRMQAAQFKASKGAYVDLTTTMSRSGAEVTSSGWKPNRAGGSATPEMAEQWANMGSVIEALVDSYVLDAAELGWKSGRCVELRLTTDPEKRTGLSPSATVAVTAEPRSKIDGGPAGGTVTAALVGATSIDPIGTPVAADAAFTYTAPPEKDAAATASFEARSKRGIATAKAAFDTKASRGYFIGPSTGGKHTITGLGIGSTDDGGSMGTAQPADVCDITVPFTLTSPSTGGKQTFTPTSPTGGTTTYTTTMPMTGFVEKGKGTYTLVLEGDGGTITTKVKGKLTIPGAGQSYKTTGTQIFRLDPTTSCS